MYYHWTSNYEEGRVGIQLWRRGVWDPIMKKGGLGSNYEEGRVGIQLWRREGWDPINWFNPATFVRF